MGRGRREVGASEREDGGGLKGQPKGQDRARKHTAAWHKEIRDVFAVKQAEPGGGAEGGDGLQRVACDGLMLA